MKPIERVEIALQGGMPDRVPIVPIYDEGYVIRSIGRDRREIATATAEDRIRFIEENFLRHEVDGFFTHIGTSDQWMRHHAIEKFDDYWMVTDKQTGRKHRLLPDGWRAEANGTPILVPRSHGGVSKIQTWKDLEERAPKALSEQEVEASGRYGPLRHLTHKYPDQHFSFQLASPMVPAVRICGGYVEGLMTLATDRELFKELLARCVPECCHDIIPGKKAGGRSAWFTSYYTGADTISPRDYAELVFPYEYQVCKAAKDQGLYVLHWFLGDLMPILDKVMELPLDALVLEQGRRGYVIDPVEIRQRVGPKFCLFGFGYENDYCTFNREGLTRELERQISGAGRDGAFIVGTPIMPPNAQPEAVDFYFSEARRLGKY